MSILGNNNQPKTVDNVPMTQSTQGYPIPVVLGAAKTHQNLIFMGPMNEQKVSGGKGGGKGANSYEYFATVIAALCCNQVSTIGNVWAGQSWLSTLGTNEGIVVTANYSPANAAVLIADNGVTLANTYSETYTDYGQPASTVLSGTDNAPMRLVAYNYSISPAANSAALTTGQYSISTASIGTFTLTAVANASGGNTVYTGTFSSPSGASNGFVGFRFAIADFVHPANNGTFTCVASSATAITLNNASGVAETHAGTAQDIGNTYHFSSADVGKSAEVWYQFNLSLLMQQDIFVVPASSPIGGSSVAYAVQVSNQYTPTANISVQYYGEFNSLAGQALTQVSSTPTAAGTYKFVGAVSIGGSYYTYYQFSAADLGQEMMATWTYTNQSAVGQTAPELVNFELFGGAQGQAVWPFLETGGKWQLGGGSANVASGTMPGNPAQALGYTKIAYVGYGPMFLGESAQISDNTFEVITPDGFGGGIVDCNPIQCVYRVLTDTGWGLGSGTVPFPVSAIDNGASGTWGGAVGTPGTRSVGSTAWNWFAANNFFISPKIDSQDSAASVMAKWLEAGQCAAFMSEGLLKLVPYGSTSVAANGCTWIGPQSYVVALDDTCFVSKEGEDPVKTNRSAWQDAYNKIQVGFSNRSNQYEDDVCQEWDQAAINRFGLRQESAQSWSFIRTLTAAQFAAIMRVKRMTSIRNGYTFTLPFTYSYLEPMDIVTLTTSSIWAAGFNNVNLGVVNLPVRITKIVDDPKNGLEITCEDYQALAAEPVLFNKGISGGSTAVTQWAQPGNSEVVMFEATNRLTQQKGNEIWIGACGTTATWGETNVWVSQDGENYLQVGTIDQAARLGVLASSFATGSDPDTVNSLVVDLAENCAPLDAGSDTDADNGVTLCFVDGEIVSFSACTVTADNTYTMNTYLRRGQMGSTIGAHAAGSLFMRLDAAIFKYTYDPTWAGQTLYFKFQSVNQFNNNAQLLSSLTATTFVVPGLNPGTIDASSGIVLNTPANTVGAGPLGWTPAATTTDATLNYGSYGYTSMVAKPSAVNGTYFYARWTGYLIPTVTGEYTIGLNFDDGASLYVGGQVAGTVALSATGAMAANLAYLQSAKIMLTAGVPYPIVVEWSQAATSYGLQLLWTPPKSSAQLVPSTALSTSNASVTGNLSGSWWNGTTGLYFPAGNGLIDPSNKTLYGPPTSGGGTNVVAAVTSFSNTIESPTAGDAFTVPGWIVGQVWSAGGQVALFTPSTTSGVAGYVFVIGMNSGSEQCYINKMTSFSTNTQASITGLTFYTPTNSVAVTGWWNFAIYIGAKGYMACWINGNLASDCTDTTYTPNTANVWYGVVPGYATSKLAPAPTASGSGSTALNPQGSIASIPAYTFTYAPGGTGGSTSTAITWSWGAFVVYNPDGSSFTVSSGSQVFTGLSASTTYTYSMYLTLNGSATGGTVNFLATSASQPTTAQQAVMNSDGNVPIIIGVTATTDASGGTGGGGTGTGGGRNCFSPNTKIRTQRGSVAIIDLIAGEDQVLTARGTWRTVDFVTVRNWHGPMLDMGSGELSTTTHLVLDEDKWSTMEYIAPFPQVDYDSTLHNVHVECGADDDGSALDTEHSYTLANGLIVHNVQTL